MPGLRTVNAAGSSPRSFSSLLSDARANRDLVGGRDVGNAFEKKNPLDHPIRVFHFVDGLVPVNVGEHLVTPVFAHLGMYKVLIILVSSLRSTSFSTLITSALPFMIASFCSKSV